MADAAEPFDDTPPEQPEGETNRFDEFLENLEETEAPTEVPPRRARRKVTIGGKGERVPKEKKALPRWKDGAISAYAERMYKAIGAAALLSHDPEMRFIGEQIIEMAYQCGEAWEKVAKRNELVRRFFDRIMSTSDFGELLWAHAPIMIPIVRKFGPFRSRFEHIQDQFEEEFNRQEAA